MPQTMALCGPVILALAGWWIMVPDQYDERWKLKLSGIAYNPTKGWDIPSQHTFESSQVEGDLQDLKKVTNRIRTYSSVKFLKQLAAAAQDTEINILAGAWVGVDSLHDEAEIESLIAVSRTYPNLRRLLIGNESLLRHDLTPRELGHYISRVQSETDLPVSTAEPWHIWLENPELASAVDFIGLHILPYWEGISIDDAVPYIDMRIREIQNAYPDKPIILAEVGWPSGGPRRNYATPSPVNQAVFMKEFQLYAATMALDYIVLEAHDQPWKIANEGRVGSHWGIFTIDRKAKWDFGEFDVQQSNRYQWALIAILLGLFLHTMYLRTWPTFSIDKMLYVGTSLQFISAGTVVPFMMAADRYLDTIPFSVWLALSFAQIPLWILLAADVVEFGNVAWKKHSRLLQPQSLDGHLTTLPHVSIHLPCSNEPPEIVSQCLRSLSLLNYPSYEVIVVSNNCTDKKLWKPIEKLCSALGNNFRFLHTDHCPGYKAGALNIARKLCSKSTTIIAVVDSDYIVSQNWLISLVPAFRNQDVGLVQAPQDHRSDLSTRFQRAAFWEYSGFFQIGMIQRNEANAVIQHGTMTLVRAEALDEAGGWSEWCLTEDTELGFQLLCAGWEAMYTNKSYGHGLLQTNLKAYKNQRFRWVYGGMQILRHHFLYLIGLRPSSLTWSQRYHFIAGWLPWLSDLGGLVFTIGALGWTAIMSLFPEHFPPPVVFFILPALGLIVARQLRNYFLYKLRVNCRPVDRLNASIAGLALSHSIAKAVFVGLIGLKGFPFVRTPKQPMNHSGGERFKKVGSELILLFLTMILSIVFCLRTGINDRLEVLWLFLLIAHSLPSFCALWLAHRGRRRKPI